VSAEGTARRRRSEGPGWLATAGGALVLVVVGFALGLVAGAAFEEPALVADHLAGRTTEVSLREHGKGEGDPGAPGIPGEAPPAPPAGESTAERAARPAPEVPRRPLGATRSAPGGAEAPAVAAAPPAPSGGGPAASASRGERAPAPAPPPDGTGFAVQVGAFSERAAADALAAELRAGELDAYVAEGEGAAPWKVRVGPVADRSRAEALASRLKAERRLPTWILSRDAR